MAEDKEKGFVIKDRRFFDETGDARKEEQPKPEAKPAEKEVHRAPEPEPAAPEEYLPEANFANLIMSLSTSVMFHFGDFPDPATKKAARNIVAAKHTIDILGMLKAKTEGNLDETEKQLLEGILFELRMRYVKEKDKG